MAKNHKSFFNFVYGIQPQFPQPQLQLPRSNNFNQNFYSCIYGHDEAQFSQYGSKEFPIDVDELDYPAYGVNNFDLNMSPSPENISQLPEEWPLPEIDGVQEVIDISDDDSEPDKNPFQIQHQEPSPMIYCKTWQRYHSPVHDWGGIVPFNQTHALAAQTPYIPTIAPAPYTQPSTLSSTMAQFITGHETTSEYGMEVSSQPNLLNFTNYLRFF